MSLQSLVLCSDERIVRVLRRVLSELDIRIEQAADADTAIRKLTRRRFEAVIVDCADEYLASLVLRSARTAPCNKHAVAVAMIDGQKAVRSAFDLGAHFVLYKPISMERAKSSFRAARALMKRERRRNARVPVEIPITLFSADDQAPIRTVTLDLGEGGVALKLPHRPRVGNMRIEFALPGNGFKVECTAEVAWENVKRQSGIRFGEISTEAKNQIRSWLISHTPELEPDDPPTHCKLSDLSLGGCYLETSSPFPIRTAVILSMRVEDLELQAEGVVRVMHPEIGMGVEFTKKSGIQKDAVEKFIHALAGSSGQVPDLRVEPEGLLSEEDAATGYSDSGPEDALLRLFANTELTADTFRGELLRQRREHSEQADALASQ